MDISSMFSKSALTLRSHTGQHILKYMHYHSCLAISLWLDITQDIFIERSIDIVAMAINTNQVQQHFLIAIATWHSIYV